MSTFFLDVWHDLKQKRLWPVAVALLVAAIAVPLVLIKPVSDDEAPAPSPTADATRPVVSSTDEPEAGSSDLGRFGSKNPFRSGLDPVKETTSTDSSSETEIERGDTAEVGSSGGGADPQTAGTAADSSTSSGSSSGSTSGGGSGVPVSGGGGSGGDGGGGSGSTPVTEYFAYTVDVIYGRTGSARKFEGLRTLEVLTERNPRLMFLGTSEGGDTAAFSVLDPTLRARGEGKCVEVGDSCSALFLREGQEQRLAEEDGDEYRLRLLDIHEVRFNR